MISSIASLKSRFTTADVPSQKDFVDLLDTLSAANTNAANALAAVEAITLAANSTPVAAQVLPPTISFAHGLWVQLDASGIAVRTYSLFTTGVGADNMWHSRHPIPPGQTVIVSSPTFDITNIATYNGGGYPGSGPMWEINTDLQGKFPLGVSANGTTFAIGTTGGEVTHTLEISEIPSHTHNLLPILSADASTPSLSRLTAGNANSTNGTGSFLSESSGGGNAHNNMPPYAAVYFLRRTARLDYIVAPGT